MYDLMTDGHYAAMTSCVFYYSLGSLPSSNQDTKLKKKSQFSNAQENYS